MHNTQTARSSKRKILVAIGLIALLGIAILGIIYFGYARRESRETVTDIPGKSITTQSIEKAPAPSSDKTSPQVTSPESRNPTAVISGFEGRQASGDVTIITTTEGTFIRLEDNFDSSRAAPDNRVYLGNAQGRQIEIAKLKAPSGGQNFRIPDDVNVSDYTHIWIHCKAYNTTYGSGQIKF